MGKNTGRLGRKGIAVLLVFVLVFQAGSVHGETNGGVRGFVQRLYQVVLNREPEADGWEGWIRQALDFWLSGAEIARGFFCSRELSRRNLDAGLLGDDDPGEQRRGPQQR